MARKLTEEVKEEIKTGWEKGLKPKEISETTGLSRRTIYNYFNILNSGFLRRVDYRNYLSRQRGFNSHQDDIDFAAREEGWKSYEYKRLHTLERAGYKSSIDYYRNHFLPSSGCHSRKEYESMLARRLGGTTSTDYQRLLRVKRSKKLRNRILSKFILRRLEELGKSRRWLAKELGKPRTNVSYYTLGESFPPKETLDQIYHVLGKPTREIGKPAKY